MRRHATWPELASAVAVHVVGGGDRLEDHKGQRMHRHQVDDGGDDQRLAHRLQRVKAVGRKRRGVDGAVVHPVHRPEQRRPVHGAVQPVEQGVVQDQHHRNAEPEPPRGVVRHAVVQPAGVDEAPAIQGRVDQPEHRQREQRITQLAPQVAAHVEGGRGVGMGPAPAASGRRARHPPGQPRHREVAHAVEGDGPQRRRQHRVRGRQPVQQVHGRAAGERQ